MIPDEYLNIDTPENVVFGYEVVGIGSRFLAALADTLLIAALQVVALLGFAVINVITGTGLFDNGWALAAYGLVSFLLLWGYYIYFELSWNGRSPGKKWAGIRVIRRDGTPITLAESIIRNLVRVIDFIPLAYGVGVVTMFIDGRSRRLGDMVAGTLVVREEEEVTLASVQKASKLNLPLRAPSVVEGAVATWPVDQIAESDIVLAEKYLERRGEIHQAAGLGDQILERMLQQMGLPKTAVPNADKIYVLACIVKTYRTPSAP